MKKSKKRIKPYAGADAAQRQPTIHRYSAVVRSPLGEWWHDHKRQIKIASLVGGTVIIVGYLLFEFFRLVL